MAIHLNLVSSSIFTAIYVDYCLPRRSTLNLDVKTHCLVQIVSCPLMIVQSIYEPPHPIDKDHFSYKVHAAGLKFEIGVCIRTAKIVWAYGGVGCGEFGSDLKLARDALVDNALGKELLQMWLPRSYSLFHSYY